MVQFVIYFKSKTEADNYGYVFRNRKVGFSSVRKGEYARKFKTPAQAEVMLADIKAREGDYYAFEIREI